MNFNQITYFLAILRTGTFSEAAEETFISQSSISKQIKALEDELGTEIFRRDRSKIYLTDAGYQFFTFAEKVNAERIELDSKLKRYTLKSQDTIFIGSIPVLTAYGLSTMFAKFQVEQLKHGQNINFDLFSEEQNTVFHALKTNKIDLAFLRPPYLSTDLYDSLLIDVDDFVFVCHKSNALSKETKLNLNKLVNERVILLTPRSTLYQTCIAELSRHNIVKSVVSTTGRHEVILEMVNSRLGVTILPRRLVNKQTYPNLALVELLEPFKTKLVLTKHKNRKLSKVAQDFWDFVKTNYAINASANL